MRYWDFVLGAVIVALVAFVFGSPQVIPVAVLAALCLGHRHYGPPDDDAEDEGPNVW